MTNQDSQPPQDRNDNVERNTDLGVLESTQLLKGNKTVLIHHQGEYYRLTQTRNGKLLLQK